jgi:hypothetical protein
MLKIHAGSYIKLGEKIEEARTLFNFVDAALPGEDEKKIRPHERDMLRTALTSIWELCKDLDLPVSKELFYESIDDPPHTGREFSILSRALENELRAKLLIYVPSHRVHYYDMLIKTEVRDAFPKASQEITWAGDALALELSTASVFHSMRAAEIGVRTLGQQLGAIFPYNIELAEWHNILDQIDAKIRDMKQLPKGTAKDDDLQFYSEAAAQFRYFKDGWRIRVAHARATYDESQATTVLDHVVSFFEILARRLKEPI